MRAFWIEGVLHLKPESDQDMRDAEGIASRIGVTLAEPPTTECIAGGSTANIAEFLGCESDNQQHVIGVNVGLRVVPKRSGGFGRR